MVNRIYWREQNAVVAVLTDFRCLDMRWILADCVGPVVAAEAIAGDIDVIEIGRNPAICGVAIVAGVAAGDMRRVFARGYRAVVTG